MIAISFSIFSQLVRFGFIGNSISRGTGLSNPQKECYPSQIGLLLSQKFGDTCTLKNFAVSNRTILKHGDFPIWNEPDFVKSLNYAPDVLFVMLGTNDSKPQNWVFFMMIFTMIINLFSILFYGEILAQSLFFVCHHLPLLLYGAFGIL